MNVVYGIHPIEVLLSTSPSQIEALYVAPKRATSRKVRALMEKAREHHIPVNPASPEELPPNAPAHQGVWARTRPFRYLTLKEWLARERDRVPSTLIVLDGITDPHNVGAIIRTASCLGCQGILLPKNRNAPISPAVWKTSAGAAAALPILRETNLVQCVKRLKREGFWVFGSRAEGATPLWQAPWSEKSVIVLGSEEKGIRPLLNAQCDFHLAIPMTGPVTSLNVSVAAGMILYERLRWVETREKKE